MASVLSKSELAAVLRAVAVEHVMMHVADITGEPWDGTRW
jgi:hypothetical protein